MKDLYTYIDECGEGCATPANTMGMGDVMLPDGENLGVDGIPKKKRNKKKKISESIFDEEDTMNRMEDEVNTLKWLAENTEHGLDTSEAFSLFNKNITFNLDGTFDLPPCSFLGVKSYTFNIDKELPSYVKFGTLSNRYNIFNINARGSFKTTGFPRSFMSKNHMFNNCTIHAPKLETLFIEEGTCNNIDLFIINTSAGDVWMDKFATIFNAELNRLDRKCKNALTTFHSIPGSIQNLGLSDAAMERLLKEYGAIGWGTKLIKK
jgi:hypothetical protein